MDWLRKNKYLLILSLTIGANSISCIPQGKKEISTPETSKTIAMNEPKYNVTKSDAEWQKELSPEQYYVMREAGTERPFTGKFNMHFENGVYTCGACGEELFSSTSKFDGHCGWPSFDKEIKEGKIVERVDTSHGMKRTEILCGNCGSHLGHVFDDGPTETGLRYCVNSLSLDFKPVK